MKNKKVTYIYVSVVLKCAIYYCQYLQTLDERSVSKRTRSLLNYILVENIILARYFNLPILYRRKVSRNVEIYFRLFPSQCNFEQPLIEYSYWMTFCYERKNIRLCVYVEYIIFDSELEEVNIISFEKTSTRSFLPLLSGYWEHALRIELPPEQWNTKGMLLVRPYAHRVEGHICKVENNSPPTNLRKHL